MSDPLERLKATHEAENGGEVVTQYGIGVVAFEERMNGYVLRYEADTVPQLLDLIAQLEAKWKQKREATKKAAESR